MSSPSHTSAALQAALARVAETSFFAYAEQAGPHAILTATEWYAASVRFRGPLAGTVSVAVPVPLANDLACAFLGDDAVDEQTVRDLCGEFVNQITGTWLTGLDDGVCFDIDGPVVARSATPPAGGVTLLVNDQPAILRYEPAGAAQ
jgi:hypothetical protein